MSYTPISQFPQRGTSEQYAQSQQAYEADLKAGRVSRGGALELAASRMAGEAAVSPTASQLELLLGSDIRVSVSWMESPQWWTAAPYLGSLDRLHSTYTRLEGFPVETRDEHAKTAWLESLTTFRARETMRLEVRGHQGALVPG